MLLLSDRVDEWMLSYLREFNGKVAGVGGQGDLDLAELADEEEKKRQSEVAETFKPLIERLQRGAGRAGEGGAGDAAPGDSPACVVVGQNELSPHLLRMLKAAAPGRRRRSSRCWSQPDPR